MDQRSDEPAVYLGMLPIGMVMTHVWDDGSTLPALLGFDGEDDGGEDDGGDDADDDTDDGDGKGGDDDDDDDDEDDPDKIKDPKRRRAARQAAQYRTQRNAARTARDAAKAEVVTLKEKLAKAEKDGAGDETLKARVADLEAEVAAERKRADAAEKVAKGATIEKQVSNALGESKDKFQEDVEVITILLERNGMLEPDEDGLVEDLDKSLRRLKRLGKIHVVSDDEDDEDDDDDDKAASGSKSSGRTMNKKKKGNETYDTAALAKKYPGLNR